MRICSHITFLAFILILASIVGNSLNVVVAQELPVIIYEYPLTPIIMPVAGIVFDDGNKAAIIGYVYEEYTNKTILTVQIHDLVNEAKLVRSIPLIGEFTTYTYDTLRSEYLAVGTSKGEVAVISLYNLWFKYIEGIKSSVKLLYIAASKLVALDNSGTAYIYDINEGGWCEIGLEIGNAPLCVNELKLVTYIAPVTTLRFGKYAYDPTLAALIYSLPSARIIITNLTDAITGEPISDATLIARAVNTSLIYGTVIVEGSGYIDLPVGYVWYINITHPAYKTLSLGPFNLTKEAVGKVIELRNLVMTPGKGIYLPPPKAGEYIIELIDLSNAPKLLRPIKGLGTIPYPPLYAALYKPQAPLGASHYVLILSSEVGDLNVYYINENYEIINKINYTLGHGEHVTISKASSDGNYIVLGTNKGSIYVLKWDNALRRHYLLHAIKVTGKVVNFEFSDDYKTIIVMDENKYLHLIKVTDTALYPYLRFDRILAYNIEDGTYFSTLNDLSTVILLKEKSIEVAINLGAVTTSSYVDLRKYKLPKLSIKVINSKTGKPLNGALINLTHLELGFTLTKLTGPSGDVVFWNLVKGDYILTVKSPLPELDDYTDIISISEDKELFISLIPKQPLLELRIINARTLKAVTTPLDIYINDELYITQLTNGTYRVRLPYGNYSITIMPSVGYEYRYNITTINITLSNDTVLNIPLLSYNLTLTFIDSFSNGKPVVPLTLIVDDIVVEENLTSPTYTLELSPGAHIVRIEPNPLFTYSYLPQELLFTMDRDLTYIVKLNRKSYELSLRIIDPEGDIIAPLNIYVNETLIVSNTTDYDIKISLIFGNHSILIKPLPGYENAYKEIKLNVSVRNNLVLETLLKRKTYELSLKVVDKLLAYQPIIPVRIFIDDTLINETNKFPILINVTYGLHKIRIEPTDLKVYKKVDDKIFVRENVSKIINLERKVYTLAVTVQNDVGEPAPSAIIRVYGELGTFREITDVKGTAFLIVPYGSYTLEVTYPGYLRFIQAIDVSDNKELTIVLKPTVQTLVIRFLPIIITTVSALAVVIVFLKLRAKIAEKIIASEEYF